jgi:beta-glucanase (GH16 family)
MNGECSRGLNSCAVATKSAGYLLLALVALLAPLHAQTRWKLVWSDEFKGPAGSAPDPSKWVYDLGSDGWGNHELENYTDSRENSRLDGKGHLVIAAVRTPSGQYTSARLKTLGKYSTQYGKIQARIKLPYGQGIWPAFWMMGDDIESVQWPACGEVDIMENIGSKPLIQEGSAHGPNFPEAGMTATYKLPNHRPYYKGFHKFTLEWSPNKIVFFVDGVSYETVTPAALPPSAKWSFEHPFFFLLNVAVGGDWPGKPDDTTKFPQEMLVDYVRVWKAK